jgi:DNA (cytosine-5)-methyltransferase 1
MRYLSVCSGIEAATVAWHPLGWEPLAFSEIEPFPRKVLAHHYPDVPCHGDFTVLRDQDWIVDADLLVGGTPCQAFSVAGLRQSLSDDRGNLTLEFVRLADAIDDLRRARGDNPAIIVWENVPGVLSVKDNAFGCFLAALVGNDSPLIPTGGKWTNAGMVVGPKRSAAWRVLDAQYFGVAQRRRRVFVVAGAGDGFDPAEVLFEREGMRRDIAPRRETREEVTELVGTLAASGSGTSRPGGQGNELDFYITGPITAGISKGMRGTEGIESNWAVVHGTQDPCVSDIAFAQGRNNGGENVLVQPIAFNSKDYGSDATTDMSPTLRSLGAYDANGGGSMAVAQPINIFGGNKRPDRPEGGFYVDMDAITSKTLDSASGLNPTAAQGGTAVMQPMAYASSDGIVRPLGDVMSTLDSARESRGSAQQRFIHQQMAVGTDCYNGTITGDISMTLKCGDGNPAINQPTVMQPVDASAQQRFIHQQMAVRRLTPKECERLQGFPDDYTDIPKAADGPRYKALGNSMAVPVMRWIGQRVQKHILPSHPVI